MIGLSDKTRIELLAMQHDSGGNLKTDVGDNFVSQQDEDNDFNFNMVEVDCSQEGAWETDVEADEVFMHDLEEVLTSRQR
jgi:hypothetical protein